MNQSTGTSAIRGSERDIVSFVVGFNVGHGPWMIIGIERWAVEVVGMFWAVIPEE
jgi:hypothetical protein